MCRILIFGGTTEGRLLASFCAKQEISAWVCVATAYGETVLPESSFLRVQKEPMDEGQIEAFIKKNEITVVFDATHPYAALVTQNCSMACERTGVRYFRVLRDSLESVGEESSFLLSGRENRVRVDSVEAAARYLMGKPGNVLVTTGSKELFYFTRLDFWKERVYARVLPSGPVILACEEMGFSGSRLIAMQGPFSEEFNIAMLRQLSIQYLVTKEAGREGGFLEKIEAAEKCNITSVVVGRPTAEKGISLSQAEKILSDIKKETSKGLKKKRIFLIGIGMGAKDQLTLKAYEKLRSCQAVFGAERMLSNMKEIVPGAVLKTGYLSQDILPWLKDHPEISRASIVCSGDTGFYSGARKIAAAMEQEPYCDWYEIEMLPGISSVSYLCAKLKTGWEDVRLVSLHGRQWDILKEIRENTRVFALSEGGGTIKELCRLLIKNGFENTRLTVGERLSYPDERILSGSPETMMAWEFHTLAAVLIERE